MHDFEEQEESGLGWTLVKWTYFIFKVAVIIGLTVGILSSQQCRNFTYNQLIEICEMIKSCD